MPTVGVFEAKAKLSELIDEVNTGKSVTITRHGEPVARLVSARQSRKVDRTALVAEIRRARKAIKAGRFALRAAIEQGRD